MGEQPTPRRFVVRPVLASSRYLISLAAFAAFLASAALIVSAAIAVVNAVWDQFSSGAFNARGVKAFGVKCIELTDLFLLGTVIYIVALGLYELFVEPDLPMPSWLRFDSLDDLKDKLTGVIVVLLAVTFLTYVTTWSGTSSILYLGAAIGSVITALGLFFWLSGRAQKIAGKNWRTSLDQDAGRAGSNGET